MHFRGLASSALLVSALALSGSAACAQQAAEPAAADLVTTAPDATAPAPPPITPQVVPAAQPPAVVTVPDPVDEDQAEAKAEAAEIASPPPPLPPAPVAAPASAPAAYNPMAPSRPPMVYARPPVDTSGTPVHVDEIGRTPDRPLNPYDMSYDARLRASSASAQGMLGPLDGSWRLNVEGAGDVYALELVDRGGQVEGAWRDLRRAGLTASGFVDDIQRLGSTLTVRFESPTGVAQATLSAQADGRWTGEIVDGDRRRPATLRRN